MIQNLDGCIKLMTDRRERRAFLGDLLHDIKYNSNAEVLYQRYGGFDLNVIDSLTKEEFTQLCILATYIEQAFYNRKLPPPEWVLDGGLYLDEPYFTVSKEPKLVFFAPQACLTHNVFLYKSEFEVL